MSTCLNTSERMFYLTKVDHIKTENTMLKK